MKLIDYNCAIFLLIAFAVPTFAQDVNRNVEKKLMQPELVTAPERRLVGIETRTTNLAEANPQTARIGALWQKFSKMEGSIPNRRNTGVVFGVYTKYESDYRGEYSLIISSEVSGLGDVREGMTSVTIPSGRYLLFRAKGEMPAALIGTWARVWKYFSETPEYHRAYTTDFELHDKADGSAVDVYIAIK